ncbi:motility associated factor glycosyltransferase family protein [Kurthia gibsonii]|uniref:motility associated factor glycosyltransferase family protein n=1 Tax=Kurthia gibsonii TaxID=33946 RepID=UPI001144F91F|nr:6-hydroxymethylpterin diphosphokinase MptE-like protein [Kurthia gibsonii]GED20747.1 hypothetical protein KGI01_24880 [Kurthia gibsonii]
MENIIVEELISKSGDPTLKINNYLLHSKYNPKKEARLFVEKQYKVDNIVILFGYGFGYILDEFIKQSNKEKILVIDPHLIPIKKYPDRVFFINETNEQYLEKEIMKHVDMRENCYLVISPNYDKIFGEIYINILRAIKNTLFINKIHENTVVGSSVDWFRNHMNNLKHAIEDSTLIQLKQITNKPVVVASGGPSLTKQLELVKQHRDKFILIASGSTIRSLARENIEPDYVVSIDGSEENLQHFKDIGLKSAKFIYAMQSKFEVRKEFNDAYYFLSSSSLNLQSYLENITQEPVAVLLGGGSVAHFALAIATYISTGEIALIGQDLAYTDGLSHAQGNKRQEKIDFDNSKTSYIKMKGYYGEDVYTDYPFLSMKKTFEVMRAQLKDRVGIFNCTEGGIYLEGYDQITFKEFIEKNEKVIPETNHDNKLNTKKTYRNLLNKLQLEMKQLKEAQIVVEKNLQLINKAKDKGIFSQKNLTVLNKNDKKLKRTFKNTAMSIITAPIDLQVQKYFSEQNVKEQQKKKFERVIKQNLTLYQGYILAIENAQKIISDLIKELENL